MTIGERRPYNFTSRRPDNFTSENPAPGHYDPVDTFAKKNS